MGNVEDCLVKLDADVSNLKGDVSDLKEDVSLLKGDVSILKEDVSLLKEDVDFVRGTVTRLENVHGKKIDVLFDGYMQLTQRADRTDEHDAEQDRLILTQLFPNAME